MSRFSDQKMREFLPEVNSLFLNEHKESMRQDQ